jgi:thiamine-monophosphate kinase
MPKSVLAGEFELIARIAQVLETRGPRSSRVELGIGDDAAVLRSGRERLVVTVDEQVEAVHFDLAWLDLEDVGYRSLQAAASDIAAMGAEPLAAVVGLQLPRGFERASARALARGQAAAARRLTCPIVGGNIARSATLSISTTVLGRAPKPLRRSGARIGDELWVLGDLGLARAGLRLHQSSPRLPARLHSIARRARQAFARPVARIAAGLALRGRATALIDVSDGLAGDVGHLARASEVAAVIELRALSRLVSPRLAELGDLLGEPGTSLALYGGEDYALLASGPARKRPRAARVIGHIERGGGAFLELESGARLELSGGFDHFAR